MIKHISDTHTLHHDIRLEEGITTIIHSGDSTSSSNPINNQQEFESFLQWYANIYVKKIVKLAVQYNATYAILSHNHPSGYCMPSKQDMNSTMWIYEALKTVEVKLIDHVIVSDSDFFSMAKSGIMSEIFDSELDTE